MKKIILFSLALLCTLPLTLLAQKKRVSAPVGGHKMVFYINGAKDETVLLAIHFRDKMLLRDSAANGGNGVFIFEGAGLYDEGMYTIVSEEKRPYLNFIIDGSQDFDFFLDTVGDVRNFRVTGSPQNEEMLLFQRKNVEAQRKANLFQESYKQFEEEQNEDSVAFYRERLQDLNTEMENFITDFINKNPDYLFSKLQKSYRQITVPDPPVKEDGTIDSMFQSIYYREHYWDNFDLADRRFINLPSYETKVNDYFTRVLGYQEVDTINKYMDMVLNLAYRDSLMYRFLIEWFSGHWQGTKAIGHDAIFVHLIKENMMKGKCTWMDDDLLERYNKRARKLEPLLIRQKSVELVIPDTNGTSGIWYSSYKMPKKYVILWFYDLNCHTCKAESEKLRQLYDSLETIGERNFDVYAINTNNADLEAWKKYVREKEYPWVNVGGLNANVDYMEAYNIYEFGTPQMYILNEKREIILNKNISKSDILDFLKQYEKIEVYRASRKQ